MINAKAQGSLEYLLMIGVVILIAAIVVAFLTGTLSLGRAETTSDKVDSLYGGLEDVMDLSKNKATILLKLKSGENIIEFGELLVTDTIWELFSKLPVGTLLQFNNSPGCGNIDANKTIPSAYFQLTDTLQRDPLNSCKVPDDARVTITIPEDVEIEEIEYTAPIGDEGYITLATDSTSTEGEDHYISSNVFITMLRNNQEANFKLEGNVGFMDESDYVETNLNNTTFSGIIDGNNNFLTINLIPNEFIFETLKNAKLENIIIDNSNTDVGTIYLAESCMNAQISNVTINTQGQTLENCKNPN